MIAVDALESSDRNAWQELFNAYRDFYGHPRDPEVVDRAWDAFAEDTVMHALGARLEGQLVGIVHFLVHANTQSPDVCYLEDLYTAPNVRGEGVGRALIDAVATWARAQGCVNVYWHTQGTNATARRLYDRVAENRGFIVYTLPL